MDKTSYKKHANISSVHFAHPHISALPQGLIILLLPGEAISFPPAIASHSAVKPENDRAMLDTVKEYGNYPLQL